MLPDEGPTLDEVKKEQRSLGELRRIAVDVFEEAVDITVSHQLEHTGVHLAADAAKHLFASASVAGKISLVGSAFGEFLFAYEVTKGVYDLTIKKWMAEGREQAEGRDRDQKNFALLMVVQVAEPGVLPDGYYQSECSRVLGTAGKAELFENYAFKSATALLGKAETDPELARSRDILVASMREGVTTAYQMGIDSEANFKNVMATDPGFRSRFASDPAFRNGIESVLWQATFHRDEYDAAVRLNVGSRVPTGRM
jgi:hypothetical protein